MGPKNPSDSLEISPYVESGESICWACCVILSLGSRVAWPWFCRRWRCYLGRQRLGGYGSVISMVLIWVGGFLKMDGQMENLVNILWTSYDIRNLGVPPFSETSTWGDGPKWTSGPRPQNIGNTTTWPWNHRENDDHRHFMTTFPDAKNGTVRTRPLHWDDLNDWPP